MPTERAKLVAERLTASGGRKRGTASGNISWIIIYVGDKLYFVTGSAPVGRVTLPDCRLHRS